MFGSLQGALGSTTRPSWSPCQPSSSPFSSPPDVSTTPSLPDHPTTFSLFCCWFVFTLAFLCVTYSLSSPLKFLTNDKPKLFCFIFFLFPISPYSISLVSVGSWNDRGLNTSFNFKSPVAQSHKKRTCCGDGKQEFWRITQNEDWFVRIYYWKLKCRIIWVFVTVSNFRGEESEEVIPEKARVKSNQEKVSLNVVGWSRKDWK